MNDQDTADVVILGLAVAVWLFLAAAVAAEYLL